MSLPKYAEYKDSGIEWMGSIPSRWSISQSRRMFRVRSEPALADDQMLTASQKYGVLPQAEFMLREGRRVVEVIQGIESLKHVEPDDFIISMRSFQGGIEWCRLRGSTSFHYVMLTPVKWVWPPFFAHVLKSMPYIQALRRTTDLIRDGQELRFSNFAQVPLPVVPIEEQRKIATFLDRETGKIDALIAEQENLLTLLAEKRQATISHAVTRGLNPNVPIKDSGVPWLGEVPSHWLIVRIKHAVRSIEQGWSPQCEGYPAETPDEWGVLKVGCVNGGVFTSSENKRLPGELEPIAQYALKQGDLLISRANTRELVGGAAVVTEDHPKLLLCDKLYRLRMDATLCVPEFLAAFLSIGGARSQIELRASGASSSMLNIGQSVILDMPVTLPSIEEQVQIVDFIRSERQRLEELQHESMCAITLLKERRSALIAAAVTGKIDVRQAA
jgi:type I restriction enzyme, S subunit